MIPSMTAGRQVVTNRPFGLLTGVTVLELCVAVVALGAVLYAWILMRTPVPPLHFHAETEAGGRLFGLGMVLMLLIPAIALYWLGSGIMGLMRRSPGWWAPWLYLGLLGAVVWHAGSGRAMVPVSHPITAEEEARYLEFALVARAGLGAISDSSLYLDLGSPYGDRRSPARDALREQLSAMLPDYWPRHLLICYVDKDCVVLSRGSGMMGQLGLMIYDRGPAVFHSLEERKANPYLPTQSRITDRLWFFVSG